ncbi:cystathionine beta-lyase [Qipengyuania sp. DY56-A-20]|jgi:cysteine-S-conjugate beta-lyase|uniref:Cystathionine beta-lyase n=1 Tax=Qipengyuania benthica TaxID=3067651 RepID=A0ABT9H6H8_9SPHN|nr:cystathionine beta-lyase [Qipengyuania sp. DY56-A-20]MDP4538924.1 cystathionine beta-lyase [Qipengyuania sp. DY56-A-20]
MTGTRENKLLPATRLVTGGRSPDPHVVNPPVYRASTHLYADCADLRAGTKSNADGNFFYGRRGSPTQWALAEALTALEPGAQGTVLYPSGVAAIAGALLAVLKPGDVLLVTDNAYDPSRAMAKGLLARLGIDARFFDPLDIAAYRAAFCDRTRAVWLENPGSLTMEVCDIPALADEARERGAVSLIDNTWATSLGFPALDRGCDITVQALTKHVGGHSDLMMGAASAGERWHRALRRTAQELGHVVSPDDAALALRGLRTMQLRLERSTRTALALAGWLSARPEVAHVLCPMLPSDTGHELWRRDFTGGCGLFSFVLSGRDDAARCRLIDALELFGIGYSWGGFESLALPFDVEPIRARMDWPRPGWQDGDRYAIRLSVGLEDQQDLIADLERALAAMEHQ